VLIVLQALDAAGKDGTIRHVMSGVNPQGVAVHSFKVPSSEELDHDYLWRYAKNLPARGQIGIFNRSHYEDVLVVRVHKLVPKQVWRARYDLINEFEKLLHVENDTTIGAMTKIQAEAYITAYSTLEEHVFVAPCVVTTNDNFMGRTEHRHDLVRGPTIRRGARIGGGAVLCPGVEIGEDAFVGAGAVVTKDVPPRVIVVGNPARELREVPTDELL